MKKIIYIILAVASSFLVSSCEKIVTVDLHSVEPRLVIEGKVPLNEYATVRLTTTKDFYSDNEFEPILGAVITIEADNGEFDTLDYDPLKKLYVSDKIVGQERVTYNLMVVLDEAEYTATSKMPPLVPIDSLTMDFVKSVNTKYPYPYVHFQDPVGKENDYYRHLVFINGKKHTLNDDAMTSMDHSDGIYVSRLITVSSNDEDNHPIKKGDEITIEQQCLDKSCFKFFNTLSNIDNSMNNPTTNIAGGALGYFSAYSFTRASIIAEW
ncbi:DUF4249 family protein [Dysgonomonas sp. 520]|uniref:DUF4249 family protein n=1 Tax=Dysgonomonas sp. 520 TaxID=2302931 RepID=UPI0013D880BB|nr:DUF4249 family protein [Dysgonomonas sp. 520]NDW10038.1 DUF4249 domain-containing protein [Dysgonomonas sp. 520]